jgi:hypothetical protein
MSDLSNFFACGQLLWLQANITGDVFRISNDAEPFSALLELGIPMPDSRTFARQPV